MEGLQVGAKRGLIIANHKLLQKKYLAEFNLDTYLENPLNLTTTQLSIIPSLPRRRNGEN